MVAGFSGDVARSASRESPERDTLSCFRDLAIVKGEFFYNTIKYLDF